jgi:hypothetical protein
MFVAYFQWRQDTRNSALQTHRIRLRAQSFSCQQKSTDSVNRLTLRVIAFDFITCRSTKTVK